MISEGIEKFESLVKDAVRLEPLNIRDDRYEHYDAKGVPIKVERPAPPRNHYVDTVESFVRAVAHYGTIEGASVWVSLTGAVAVLDDGINDEYRLDRLEFPTQPSPIFGVLARDGWFTQKEIVDRIRHNLADATIDPDNTLAALRNLKSAKRDEQSGSISHTSAAMGRSVESQITGEVNLPENVTVEFHPYPSIADELDVTVVVTCTLFIDPDEFRFQLAPRPGEIDAAKTKAKLALRAMLAEKMPDNAIYVGKP